MRLVDSEITRVGGRNDGSKDSKRFVIYPLEFEFSVMPGISKYVNPEEIV